MGLKLANKIPVLLAEYPDQKFDARQLAEMVYQRYPEECEKKKENSKVITTHKGLLKQISNEIGGAQRPYIKRRDSRIRAKKFKTEKSRGEIWQFWRIANDAQTETDEIEIVKAEAQSESEDLPFKEHDLYPKISEYLWFAHDLYSKRINENKSSNIRGAGGNQWLYPDIVGMVDLTAEWKPAIKEVVKVRSDKKTKLWSFEVKKGLTVSNVRRSYFQAVSNSSWANFGYLAAADIADTDTEKELQMLSSLHGIGVIKVNIKYPAESQIVIPAREKPEVDWATCNRLMVNEDFAQFIDLVRQFHLTDDPRPKDWDSPDED